MSQPTPDKQLWPESAPASTPELMSQPASDKTQLRPEPAPAPTSEPMLTRTAETQLRPEPTSLPTPESIKEKNRR